MADISARLSASLDGLQQSHEHGNRIFEDFVAAERDRYRGVKWMRIPALQGNVTAAGINLGENVGGAEGFQDRVAPDEGYAWSIRRVIVAGLAAGATPDVVNLYRSSSGQQGGLLWQFNGNNFGYTFGKGQMTLMPGDSMTLVSVGAVTAAVGTLITVSGEAVNVPAEMLGKLLT